MYEASDVVTSHAELRSLLGEDFLSQVNKVIDRLDEHCRAWIERSPFALIASTGRLGNVDEGRSYALSQGRESDGRRGPTKLAANTRQ